MSDRIATRDAATVPEAREPVWADVPVKRDGCFEYCWEGPAELVAALARDLPPGAEHAPIWRGYLSERFPEIAVIRFRSPEAVERPTWASRVSAEAAARTVGVFAGI